MPDGRGIIPNGAGRNGFVRYVDESAMRKTPQVTGTPATAATVFNPHRAPALLFLMLLLLRSRGHCNSPCAAARALARASPQLVSYVRPFLLLLQILAMLLKILAMLLKILAMSLKILAVLNRARGAFNNYIRFTPPKVSSII